MCYYQKQEGIVPSDVPAVMEILKRLNEGTPPDSWYFSQVSLAKILCALYPRVGDRQAETRKYFVELSKSDIPMVRRAVCSQMSDFCALMNNKIIIDEFLPCVTAVSSCDYLLTYLFDYRVFLSFKFH